MLVADHIVQNAGAETDQQLCGYLSALAKDIRVAARYALTAEAIDLAHSLRDRVAQEIRLIETLSPPERPIWIEWREPRERLDTLAADKAFPDRVGVLLTSSAVPRLGAATPDDRSLIHARLCWTNPTIAATGFGLMLDLRNPPALRDEVHTLERQVGHDPMVRRLVNALAPGVKFPGELGARRPEPPSRAQLRADLSQHGRRVSRHDLDAMFEFGERTMFVPAAGAEGLLAALLSAGMARYTAMGRSWMEDLNGGEVGAALMVIALKATGALVAEAADLDRLNRARAKNRKPLFLTHQVLDLDWKAGFAEAGKGTGRDAVRLHLQSGHFKRRATGVFWWRPHWRGLVPVEAE